MNGQKELQETVSFLKMMISCYEKKSTPRNPYKATLYSLNIALQCAEKQMPKKVYKRVEGEDYIVSACPSCGSAVIGEFCDNCYCKHCGQKLDWSEV